MPIEGTSFFASVNAVDLARVPHGRVIGSEIGWIPDKDKDRATHLEHQQCLALPGANTIEGENIGTECSSH